MWDSNGHIPSGLLSGTFTNFGDYDQCLEIKTNDNNIEIEGKYCFLTLCPIRPNKERSISLNGSKYENSWYETHINLWFDLDNLVPIANGIYFPSVCDKHLR